MKFENISIPVNRKFSDNDQIDTLTPITLLEAIKTCKYAEFAKDNRPGVSQSYKKVRPSNNKLDYLHWSGLQFIDLDIKNALVANLVKKILTKLLFKYNWIHTIALSTSKNGLHIYTYTKPLSVSDDTVLSSNMMYDYYLDCYEYKLMVVWKAMCIAYDALKQLDIDEDLAVKAHPTKHNNSEDVIDISAARLSLLLNITADDDIAVNDNFEFDELFLPDILTIYANVDAKYELDVLKEAFNKLRNRANAEIVNGVVQYADNYEFDDSFKDKIKFDESDLLISQIQPMHYDNAQRYRMAYTLAYLFNVKTKFDDRYNYVESIFLKLCSGNPKYSSEWRQWSNAFKSAVDRNIQGTCPCIWSAVKELKDVHKFDIAIDIDQAAILEKISAANTSDKITDFILHKQEYNNYFKIQYANVFNLKNTEYIGTYKNDIVNILQNGINLLVSPPGYGKTEFIKDLSKTKRVMLVEPYTSIISSKIENSDLGFDCFYADKQVNISNSLNVAMTFDKFTKIDVDEVSMLFDYVAIDETHLLMMSSYRGVVPADVINKINQLRTKVILMTGTPVAEHMFMQLKTTINCIRPESNRNKHINFVICETNADKLTKIAMHISNAIAAGKKILFPTNKGNEYLERIIASAKSFYGSNIKAKYYKKDNQLADFVDNINNSGTIGDVDVLFCSNYLSVGVDINDITQFDVIYDEQFTAQEIEQFNCRLRKLNIESYYYFAKLDSNNQPKNITQYEDLSLDLTNDEKLTFNDIKKLHTQANNSDTALFDFFKYAFSVPYFIKDYVTGEVHVHNMCFRLHKFEEKWREWAIQLNIVATFLQEYNYTCSVIQDAMSNDEDIDLAIISAKEAASNYRMLRHNLTAQFIQLANDDLAFKFICDVSFNDIVDSDKFEIVKRKGKPILLIGDNAIFSVWRRIFRTLSRYYIRSTIFDIINNYCFDKDHYNISASNRLIDALRVIQNTEDENLVDSNIYIIDFIINTVFKSNVDLMLHITNDDIYKICSNIAQTYIKYSAQFAESIQFKLKIEQLSIRIFKALVNKVDTNSYKLITLPPFDAPHALHKNKALDVIMTLFGENVQQVELNIEHNELSKKISNNVKELTQTTIKENDSNESIHSIIKTQTPITHTTVFDDIREIVDTDYKFAKLIQSAHNEELMHIIDNVVTANAMLNIDDDDLDNILDNILQ